jgi:hypothetical protein
MSGGSGSNLIIHCKITLGFYSAHNNAKFRGKNKGSSILKLGIFGKWGNLKSAICKNSSE